MRPPSCIELYTFFDQKKFPFFIELRKIATSRVYKMIPQRLKKETNFVYPKKSICQTSNLVKLFFLRFISRVLSEYVLFDHIYSGWDKFIFQICHNFT
jgi:hypothetical protein